MVPMNNSNFYIITAYCTPLPPLVEATQAV